MEYTTLTISVEVVTDAESDSLVFADSVLPPTDSLAQWGRYCWTKRSHHVDGVLFDWAIFCDGWGAEMMVERNLLRQNFRLCSSCR